MYQYHCNSSRSMNNISTLFKLLTDIIAHHCPHQNGTIAGNLGQKFGCLGFIFYIFMQNSNAQDHSSLTPNLTWQVCIQIQLLGRNQENNRKVEITHTLKGMVPKERNVNTGEKKTKTQHCVTAAFHPPPRLVLRGIFFAQPFLSLCKGEQDAVNN